MISLHSHWYQELNSSNAVIYEHTLHWSYAPLDVLETNRRLYLIRATYQKDNQTKEVYHHTKNTFVQVYSVFSLKYLS